MRLLLLAVSLSMSWAGSLSVAWADLPCPHHCDCVTGQQLVFNCTVSDSADVIFNAMVNEYVNIRCEGTNFTCADLPVINFANNLPLPYLTIQGCLPSILPCINTVLQTPSVSFLSVNDGLAPLTSEAVANLGDVQTIEIVRGPEKSIPSSMIQALPNLYSLKISNSLLSLEANAFMNSSHIESLVLPGGVTGVIPEDAFQGLTNLKTLNIWRYNMTEIAVNAFRGLDSLDFLSVTTYPSRKASGALEISDDIPPLKLHKHSFANLPLLKYLTISDCSANLPADLFTGSDKIKSLDLSMNRITSLPPKIFKDLQKLETLELNSNKIASLESEMFATLKKLKFLNLNMNEVKYLPDFLFSGCDELNTLDLSMNRITSLRPQIFKDLQKLETLKLNSNKIASLESEMFATLKELKFLNLNRNEVKYLPDFLFSGLQNLNYVSINHNLLTDISSKAFLGVENLQTLSLKYNKLTLEVNYNFGYSPFHNLDELNNLYLSGNRINRIFKDWQYLLKQLKVLDLSENNFSSLVDFNFESINLKVNLTHNNITQLILASTTDKKGDPMYIESFNSIILDDNPLECDCWMSNLAMRLQGYRPLGSEPTFILTNAVCASPEHLSGHLFKNVSPYDLNCDLPAEDCPKTCLTCVENHAKSQLAYDCYTMPSFMLNPATYDMKYLALRLKTPPKTLNNLELQLLNLSNVGLKEIPFAPSKTVQTIDFSNNKLTKVPIQFLEANTSLYLSNNQFECDCWHSEELAVLKASKNVLDIDLIKCGDKFLSTMDPLELCNNLRVAAVASGTFIALVILVAIIATIVYKNSHEILVFIIDHGLCPCCFVDDPDDINKEYDVFVSYAHKDRQYLQKLIPKLENEFGLKTCVHYRDWYVGDFIPDQINRSVEKSRKTIIILSNNFLDSAYANMEFRAAHNLALKEGKNRIILILLEDVTNHEKLSEELKAHMKLNTFLKWEDPRFTERLQRAVPLRINKKFVLPNVFKQAGEKTVKSDIDVHLNSDGQLVNVALKDAV